MELLPELLKLPTGLDWSEVWQMADADGTAIDVTGYSYELEVREKTGATVTTGTVTLSDAANGQITLSLTAEQIAALNARILHWCLIETDTLSTEQVVAYGPVEVLDIT